MNTYCYRREAHDHIFSQQILAEKLEGRVSELATNKFSSCVIEKLFVVVSDAAKVKIINEVLKDLQKLMWDGFGNFVVQCAVDNAPASMLDHIKAQITPFINDCPYGYRIEGKLNKRVKKGGRRAGSYNPSRQERSVSPENQVISEQAQRTRQAVNVQASATPIVAAP